MGYRGYIHLGTSSPLDCGKDICIGKLFGYVDDKNLSELQVLPYVAFALEYGMQHPYTVFYNDDEEKEVWTTEDFNMGYRQQTISTICDERNELTLVIPKWLLIPFLIAYYNDQQRFYITENKQPTLGIGDPTAVLTILVKYDIPQDFLQNSAVHYILYWC